MTYYVYLLRCSDGTLYCGITNDLVKRVATHNRGKGSRYTRARLPVELAYSEAVGSKEKALRREYEVKKLDRKEKNWLATCWAMSKMSSPIYRRIDYALSLLR